MFYTLNTKCKNILFRNRNEKTGAFNVESREEICVPPPHGSVRRCSRFHGYLTATYSRTADRRMDATCSVKYDSSRWAAWWTSTLCMESASWLKAVLKDLFQPSPLTPHALEMETDLFSCSSNSLLKGVGCNTSEASLQYSCSMCVNVYVVTSL